MGVCVPVALVGSSISVFSFKEILGFYVPKLRNDYEAHRSGGLRINFAYLGFLNVYPMHSRRALLYFALIEMRQLPLGFHAAPSGLGFSAYFLEPAMTFSDGDFKPCSNINGPTHSVKIFM